MATKEELVAFAEAHGIAVDSSDLKADIESAIADAGYDPTNLQPREEATVSDEGTTNGEGEGQDIVSTSSDARFSTYAEAPTEREGEYPEPGRQVEQTRGEPAES